MLKIAICDDDQIFAGHLETLILQESRRMGIQVETEVILDGNSLVESIQEGIRYSLIFLDIELEQMDGISAARHIRDMDRYVLLIFVSDNNSYFQELFEVEPFRFLSKPLDVQKFCRYFEEACRRIDETDVFYQFTFNKEVHQVLLKDVVYFESRKRMIYIFLKDGKTVYFYGKLNEVEKEITDRGNYFLRIHQSYLVNYNYIKKMGYYNVVIGFDGKTAELKVSEDREKNVRRQLCEMYGEYPP